MENADSWRRKASDLIAAIDDLDVPGHPRRGSIGTPGHQRLFDDYLSLLEEAIETAKGWWEALVDVELERTGNKEEALDNVRQRHPGGPVSHKFVIAALRRGWLSCHELNGDVEPSQRVRPEEFVLAWLVDKGRAEIAEFLSTMAYWPVGLDAESEWV
jgi:hypothetical protein